MRRWPVASADAAAEPKFTKVDVPAEGQVTAATLRLKASGDFSLYLFRYTGPQAGP
jgi:hypothetical protein